MNEATLQAIAQRALAESPFPNPLFPPSPYYRFLKHLAAEMKPRLSVVLGVCGGGCCLHLAQGYGMGMVIGIDIAYDHPEQISYIKSNHSNFSLWLGDSVDSAFEVFKDYGYVDIVFIDTIHTRQRTIQEFETWQQFVKPGGVVCFDDLKRVEMNGFWDWLQGNKVRLDDLHPSAEGGFGVWIKD